MYQEDGRIEVICGPMFAGKTSELLNKLKILKHSPVNNKYLLFKPKVDDRFSKTDVVSHDQESLEAHIVETPAEIYRIVEQNPEINVIGIDEAQFLDERTGGMTTIQLCQKLKLKGKRVILSCLDMTFQGDPFSFTGSLLAIADEILKAKAICVICGRPATMSYKKGLNDEVVDVGAKNKYEARCYTHWKEGEEEKKVKEKD